LRFTLDDYDECSEQRLDFMGLSLLVVVTQMMNQTSHQSFRAPVYFKLWLRLRMYFHQSTMKSYNIIRVGRRRIFPIP